MPLGQNVLKTCNCRPNRALWFFMQINTFLKIVLSPSRRAHFGSILEPYKSLLGRSESSWGGLGRSHGGLCGNLNFLQHCALASVPCTFWLIIQFFGNGALAPAPCTFLIFVAFVFSENRALASATCTFWLIRKIQFRGNGALA